MKRYADDSDNGALHPFILDDDTPMNPREDHDCLGKMVLLAWALLSG